jgi:tRNA(Ile2)-agmatinylcytidine synthase
MEQYRLQLMPKLRMHLGLDDTDSARNGCTTYIAALLVEKLEKLKVKFLDYPNLVRLNPNVPWKTRGNGALCLRFEYDEEIEGEIKEAAVSLLEEQADLNCKGTDPGIIFFKESQIPQKVKNFARNAITGIVTLKEATNIIKAFKGEALGYNTCRGIIGALAAVGENLEGDYTYELIAYRTPENRGVKRKVDVASIFEMDKLTQPYTFNNVDLEKRRVIITPRGPDPILLGIRGEKPEIVRKAFAIVKPLEPVERWVIFRTNQGTDAHFTKVPALSEIKPYSSVVAKAIVSRNPRLIPLRHVIFSISDDGAEVDCAAYEPTGVLRKIARKLIVGDRVEVYGAVRKRSEGKALTINLEKINVLSLSQKATYENPVCPTCNKRLESIGRGKGFRCKKCRVKFDQARKSETLENRNLEPGLYITSTRSQRHLTKPLRRYGLEKSRNEPVNMVEQWHS